VSGGDGTGEPLAEDPEEEQGSTQATDVSIHKLLFWSPLDTSLFIFIITVNFFGPTGVFLMQFC
jgi:hypothetical protein